MMILDKQVTIEQAPAAIDRDPRVISRVKRYLEYEQVLDLYEDGMTIKQALAAIDRDPRVIARWQQLLHEDGGLQAQVDRLKTAPGACG